MRRLDSRRKSRGFTLIEAVMVIVITGIIAAMVAVFVKTGVDSYFNAEQRAELTDAADVALHQLVREVRLALPNSLRVDCATVAGWCYIEFIPTSGGGRYRDEGDGSTAGDFLSFTNNADTTFDVLGPMPANPAIAVRDYIVVYNLGPGYDPANAYLRDLAQCGATPSAPACNIAKVTGVAGNTVTLDANPFARQSPPLPSPDSRFQVVPSVTRAVSYACPTAAAGDMTRFWNYGFNQNQPTAFGTGSSALVMQKVTCTVNYTPNVQQRHGLLYISLTVSDASGEQITVFQQVHVDNSP